MYRSNSALITTTPGSALPKNKQTPRLVAGLSPWPGRRWSPPAGQPNERWEWHWEGGEKKVKHYKNETAKQTLPTVIRMCR